jgi:hypothetical protein
MTPHSILSPFQFGPQQGKKLSQQMFPSSSEQLLKSRHLEEQFRQANWSEETHY